MSEVPEFNDFTGNCILCKEANLEKGLHENFLREHHVFDKYQESLELENEDDFLDDNNFYAEDIALTILSKIVSLPELPRIPMLALPPHIG